MQSEPLWTIQKCHQRKALGTSEVPRGAFTQPHMQLDPPGSLFPSNSKYSPSSKGRRLKNRASENALRFPLDHPKVPQRKVLGTSELRRGAFTQPHMQLDPPGSLFLSKPKRSTSRHRRRVKNQVPRNAFRALFAHPKVSPKEGFGYK